MSPLYHMNEGRKIKLVKKCNSASTDQLINLLLDDPFDADVVYLVMLAELLGNSCFPHSWRTNQADSYWLKNKEKKFAQFFSAS